jgi:SAM-dependent methyltransferase
LQNKGLRRWPQALWAIARGYLQTAPVTVLSPIRGELELRPFRTAAEALVLWHCLHLTPAEITGMSPYVLARDTEGAERLWMLSRVLDRTTRALLQRVGLAAGHRCLDVGCGVGAVTLVIAHAVGHEGLAVGIDADARFLELARCEAAGQGVAAVFRLGDARALQAETGYDVAYARFLLSHLLDPAQVIGQLVAATRPGGVIVVEDVDFSGHFCYPGNDAFTRYHELYQAVVRGRGADPDLGPRLPGLFEAAGVEGVQFEVLLPAFRDGEGKHTSSWGE